MACLDELRKQQVSKADGRYSEKIRMERTSKKNIVMDGDKMIDKRTGDVLNPEVDSAYRKDKF